MILVIRIAGLVNIPGNFQESLFRIGLRRKYSATLLKPTAENLKILKNLRNYIAYGDIDQKTLAELLEKRGQLIDKKNKMDVANVIKELDKKNLKAIGLKGFFRLHPPRGGIESKNHFGVGKGVLGDNKKEINKLVKRML